MDHLFEHTSIKKAYFTLALPVVLSMIVNLVYNMVDTFFVSQTQNPALVAGVSQSAPIFTFLIALGDIFGLGGSSVISRLFGNKKIQNRA
nr:MATE family efflux transporter [Limosilactobacillus equigenerosi]